MTAATAIDSLRQHAETIRAAELTRLQAKLAALSPEERHAVETVTAQIVEKLLHEPAARLTEPFVPVLRELFALEEAA